MPPIDIALTPVSEEALQSEFACVRMKNPCPGGATRGRALANG
jgi:hypothetical protein